MRRTPTARASQLIPALCRGQHKVSLLDNGLKVLSYDDHSAVSAVGLFAMNGPRYELGGTAGASTILESLLLKGNAARPQPRFSVDLCSIGSLKTANVREALGWIASMPRYNLDAGLQLLEEAALHPTTDGAVFAEAKAAAAERLGLTSRDATRLCFELIHQVAFGDAALGRPQLPTVEELDALTHANLLKFHAAFTQPERATVVGVGIPDHDAFVAAIEARLRFPAPPAAAVESDPETTYTGGSRFVFNSEAPESVTKFEEKNLTHIGMCYKACNVSHPDYPTYCVIQTLLGGGTSFSSGGPGKGLHTKLFREVVHREGWIHGVECVSAWYRDSCIIGLYGQAPHAHNVRLANMMAFQLATIADRLTDEHLAMAKNQLLSQMILLGEARDQLVEDQAKMLLLHGTTLTAADLIKGTNTVTMADLRRVCKELLESKLTYVCYGNTEKLPAADKLSEQILAMNRKYCK
jgi:processing peptidase subunit alpha